MTTGMTRLRPKLTDEDKRMVTRLTTAFICGEVELLEVAMAEVDEADRVTAIMLGLLEATCRTLEQTGPLLVEPEDTDPRDQN